VKEQLPKTIGQGQKGSMGSSSYFPAEDKLHDKSDYHGWKMSLDLTLEEQEVMDYVQGLVEDKLTF